MNKVIGLFVLIVVVLIIGISTASMPVKKAINNVANAVMVSQIANNSTLSANAMIDNNGPLNQWWASITSGK